jgi:hypothetical protein
MEKIDLHILHTLAFVAFGKYYDLPIYLHKVSLKWLLNGISYYTEFLAVILFKIMQY